MASSSSARLESQIARSVLTQNLAVRPGENVVIEGWSHSLGWAKALAREARRLKAHPVVLFEDEEGFWDTVDARGEKLLGAAPSHEWSLLGKTDVYIHMWGPGDKVRIDRLPPTRAAKLTAWNDRWYSAAAKAGLRGARLEVGRPFPTLAKAYGVEMDRWSDQIAQATLVTPKTLTSSAAPIVRALESGKKLRIYDRSGTDLTVGLAGRAAVVNSGMVTPKDRKSQFRMLTNLPAGSVTVALDERVGDGTFVSNRSCYLDASKASGIRMEMRGGKLLSREIENGGEPFDRMFAAGGAGRDRPGQIRIGLTPMLHDTPQVEDLEAGAVTFSVGGNRFLPGGKNRSPYFGFAINAGATVEIDGKPVPLPG